MTLRPVERRHYDGGAAIIARHLAALGARPVLVTPMPRDGQGEAVRRRLLADGVEVRPFAVDRALTEKQRFLVGAQKVMKLDLLEPLVLDAQQQDAFVGMVQEAASGTPGIHAAIVADSGQGLFSPALMGRTCRVCRKSAHILAGDVSGRRSNLRGMWAMDLLCPSESELREAYGAFDKALPTLTWQLLEETKSRAAAITMGPEGLIAFDPLPGAAEIEQTSFASRLRGQHVPALAPFAIDPLGCGDSLISAATLALASGGSLLAAAFLGSAAAAVEAQRLGNIPISATDLRQSVVRMQSAHMAFAPAEVVNSRSALAGALKAS
jgi:bifunctional ADP-heptose synthase (sugar kinase/adenylyltransferase)